MKHQVLLDQIFKAIEDNNQWENILELIIEYSGAMKGIITLRDMETANLLLPDEVSRQHFSPMLKGIDPAFIESYIDKFHKLDPWTAIEKQNHPHQPYVFSDFLPYCELKETPFWSWLEPQGINDAVVVELASTTDEWVALNLHFNNQIDGMKEKVINLLTDILPDLRHGWRISEKFRLLKEESSIGQKQLNLKGPYAVVDEFLTIKSANNEALNDLHKHLGLASPIQLDGILTLPDSIKHLPLDFLRQAQVNGDKNCKIIEILDSALSNARITLSTLNISSNFVGKRHGIFLVSVEYFPIWETKGLTRRQSEVVKYIAEGGGIPDFAKEYGIVQSTAYDHLRFAREELDGYTAAEIRTAHQLYLAQTR